MVRHEKLRIGLFGGTFNPPHVGHLIVAEHVCAELRLDKVFFVPSYISPHKQRGEEELAPHRLRMLRLAIKDNPRFSCSEIELERKGTSYTFQTVEAFHKKYPTDKLFVIIGADNFADFHTWKKPERILDLASLIVMNRPHHALDVAPSFVERAARIVYVPDIEISSSEIRKKIRYGDSIAYLVTSPVAQYIRRHRLYR